MVILDSCVRGVITLMGEEEYTIEEGYWMSTNCINWHHPDCKNKRCECDCHHRLSSGAAETN